MMNHINLGEKTKNIVNMSDSGTFNAHKFTFLPILALV